MEATLVFTTLTYLHHCFLFFSLLSENDANLILSSIYSKSCQSIRQSNFDWTGKRWIFIVNWACKLSSTNHKGLILKHGYPLKLHAVFESWDQRFFCELHSYLSCLFTLRTYINICLHSNIWIKKNKRLMIWKWIISIANHFTFYGEPPWPMFLQYKERMIYICFQCYKMFQLLRKNGNGMNIEFLNMILNTAALKRG